LKDYSRQASQWQFSWDLPQALGSDSHPAIQQQLCTKRIVPPAMDLTDVEARWGKACMPRIFILPKFNSSLMSNWLP
jgi:hypothetical protein